MNDPLTNIAKLWIINVWQSSKCASVPQLIRSYHSFVLKFRSLILTKRRMRGLCSFCRKKKIQNCPNDLIYITTMEQQTCLDEMKDVQFFQRCVLVDMTPRRGTTKNQRWNNVVFFNVEFHNVGQRRNNVVKITISKGTKTKKHFKLNELNSKFLVLFHNLLHFTPNF